MDKITQIDLIRARTDALAWMYVFACNALDKGEDIRDMEVPEILELFHNDIDGGKNEQI